MTVTMKSGKVARNLVTFPMAEDSCKSLYPWPSSTTFSRCSRSELWMRVRK